MLDDDSTVTGQSFNVLSDGEEGRQIPRKDNLVDGQADGLVNQAYNGKHVKIFVIRGWDEGFSTYCFTSSDKAHLSVLPKLCDGPSSCVKEKGGTGQTLCCQISYNGFCDFSFDYIFRYQ
jgi:hypothetical protein